MSKEKMVKSSWEFEQFSWQWCKLVNNLISHFYQWFWVNMLKSVCKIFGEKGII